MLIIEYAIDDPFSPSSVINRWPAIMFAVNRIANVPGRIMFLIVSIHTINGIRIGGVPCGTRWVSMCLVLLIHPNIINLVHNGRAIVNVNVRCLVLVKMYGNRPKVLFIRIIENNDVNISVLPLLIFFVPRSVLSSSCIFFIVLFHAALFRDGIIHILVGMINSPNIVLNQFIDVLNMFVDGSNTENRFLIIFSLFFLLI
jgi:hypothetical protein